MTQKLRKIAYYLLFITIFSGSIVLVSAESPDGQGSGLIYSTFVGTSSWEGAEAIEVDNNGRAYIIGHTESTIGFPGIGEPTQVHELDVVVFRLNPAGTDIEYTLYLNPSPDAETEDYGFDIAIDNAGSAYIVGEATKDDLCSYMGVVPGYDPTYNGGTDAFVMKIKPDGSGLEYCTYLGGTDWDSIYSIELDNNNNAYVTGYTWSADFPATPGAYNTSINGSRDIFVAKISADGTQLEYATYMGGTGQENALSIALDNQNNAYVTGWTTSDDLPIPATVLDDEFNGPFDGFVFKLNSDGSDLLFNTYLGGTDEDRGRDILLDDQGNIHVVGETRSPDFPTTGGAMDTTFGGGICFFTNCADGYAVRLNPTATTLDYATFIGSDNEDLAYEASLHQDGGLFITGETLSDIGFPTTASGYDPSANGEGDGYLVLINSTFSDLQYGTFLGATEHERITALWTDAQNTAFLTGLTFSSDFPTTPGSYDTQHNGDYDIFVSKLMLPGMLPGMFQTFIPAVFK